MISTYGLLSALGLFQVYWQTHQLADVPPTNISWIGSLLGFLSGFLNLPFGLVFDRWGVWPVLPIACIVYWGCFLTLAWCSTFPQFMGCFLVAGLSAGKTIPKLGVLSIHY